MSHVPVLKTVADVRKRVAEWRAAGSSVALVPTMGNLHEGHLSLARRAAQTADKVVLSIFVNPTQFGPNEDFAAYPRTLDEDRASVEREGTVQALFVPAETDIYPFGSAEAVRVTLPPLSTELCGASRPGHFDGVATVVLRLLNIVTPDVAVFGEKDYQQLILVERMVADLSVPVRILRAPIVREPDGLAMSSRNRYLTPDERARAPALHAALEGAAAALRGGEADYARVEARAKEALLRAGFRPDYVEVRDAADLAKPRAGGGAPLIVLGAAWLGRARLIDNVRVPPHG
ncbi:MAG TPA: pantoate--beta-alanine ligase [Gammaproteobacteria bacterium]